MAVIGPARAASQPPPELLRTPSSALFNAKLSGATTVIHWIMVGVAIGIGFMLAPFVVTVCAWVAIVLAIVLPFVAFWLVWKYHDPWWMLLMAPAAPVYIWFLIVEIIDDVKSRRLQRELDRALKQSDGDKFNTLLKPYMQDSE